MYTTVAITDMQAREVSTQIEEVEDQLETHRMEGGELKSFEFW